MKTTDFDYRLPVESIAQHPAEPRDSARLLVFNRQTGGIQHAYFRDLVDFLRPADLLVLNETRVISGRLFGKKVPTGGKVEILLLRREDPLTWEVIIGGKGLLTGKFIEIDGGPKANILAVLDGPRRMVKFDEPLDDILARIGQVPLPPYIHAPLADPELYQTVYARHPGSAAAPTAGLHFTTRLIEQFACQGVRFAFVTLHIGLDTFAPVTEETPEEHKIHTEWCQLPLETATAINEARNEGGRIIAVGTTSVRTLESAAHHSSSVDKIEAFEGPTDLYILPGYKFRCVDGMVTNFHLPRSTLIMLVCAFAGREKILATYQLAIEEGYRFYSFGDAMFLI